MLNKTFKKQAVSNVNDKLVSAKINGSLPAHVNNPLTGELELLDLSLKGHRAQLLTLFPRSALLVTAIQSADSQDGDFDFGQEAKEYKSDFAKSHKVLFSEIEKLAKIKEIETDLAKEIADAEKEKAIALAALQAAMLQAQTDGTMFSPDFAEKLTALSAPANNATNKAEKLKADAAAKIESVKNGKAKVSRAGDGSRTNVLPKVEEGATCFIRKANGQSVLALLGKIIPNHEAHGLSAKSMQAFQMAKDGQDKGFWKWEGTLGECTSNSNLNAKINRDVLGIGGEHNSIGVNGLSAPNAEQIELIRTTQLRGLPNPK